MPSHGRHTLLIEGMIVDGDADRMYQQLIVN